MHTVIITLPLQIQASVYMSKGIKGQDFVLASISEWYYNKSPWSTGISRGVYEFTQGLSDYVEFLFQVC